MRKLGVCAQLFLVLAGLALPGCASDIMKGYVGQSVEAAMARYGPPTAQFDLPDGRRAFQWMEIEAQTSTGQVFITERGKARVDFAPAASSYNRCFYTMYARYDPGRRQWLFESFEPPAFNC